MEATRINLGDKQDVQTAAIIVMMHRLKLRTMSFDEEELFAAMDAANPGADDFNVEYYVDPDIKEVVVKLT